MTKLPRISGRKCIWALQRAGFRILRQKGSHVILRCEVPFSEVIVPDHKELDRGTLHVILHQAGLDIDTFLKLR